MEQGRGGGASGAGRAAHVLAVQAVVDPPEDARGASRGRRRVEFGGEGGQPVVEGPGAGSGGGEFRGRGLAEGVEDEDQVVAGELDVLHAAVRLGDAARRQIGVGGEVGRPGRGRADPVVRVARALGPAGLPGAERRAGQERPGVLVAAQREVRDAGRPPQRAVVLFESDPVRGEGGLEDHPVLLPPAPLLLTTLSQQIPFDLLALRVLLDERLDQRLECLEHAAC